MILSRLKAAIREQNWFAVVLEFFIVVMGVVIGFQISAWGQDRADRDREQTYLTQLAADLRETEQILANRDERMARSTHHNTDQLMLSFGQAQRPPRNSVSQWLQGIFYTAAPNPVMGTVEALVASGDFGAIRDDSLRASILRYLDVAREWMGDQFLYREEARERADLLRRMISIPAIRDELVDLREGHITLDDDTTGAAVSPDWTYPFPHDVFDIYTSPDVLNRLYDYRSSIRALQNSRTRFARTTVALREKIEAELNR